jgi:rSAM/selenodomain-associated transferase 2
VVLERTLEIVKSTGLQWTLLEPLTDIDTPEDLSVWERIVGMPRAGHPTISVVIPTLNEAKTIEATIQSARQGDPLEIIVADGGSEDGTMDEAQQYADRVITCPRGRAHQMNAGAEVAQGDCLLFLHADTLLPHGYERYVRDTLSEDRNVCGAFRLRIEGDFRGRRFIEVMTNFRSRWLAMPYGDQALFVRSDDFRRLAGFKDMAIMEDYDFVRRARKLGRIAIAEAAVFTSSRRWHRLGALRTTAINQMMIAGYRAGVSPRTLAEYYRQ